MMCFPSNFFYYCLVPTPKLRQLTLKMFHLGPIWMEGRRKGSEKKYSRIS